MGAPRRSGVARMPHESRYGPRVAEVGREKTSVVDHPFHLNFPFNGDCSNSDGTFPALVNGNLQTLGAVRATLRHSGDGTHRACPIRSKDSTQARPRSRVPSLRYCCLR